MTRNRKYASVEQMLADARRPQRIEGPTAALPPTSHVVVGFDRCPASYHALRFAIELAAPLNAYLHVAHIIDIQDFPVDPDGDDWEQCFADTLDQERATACDLRLPDFSRTYDVLVAGGGNAALSAAIEARRAGASVIVAEHAPRAMRGGNTRHTRNLRALHPAPTDVQTDTYMEDEYWDDVLRVTGGKTDEHLARMCIRASAARAALPGSPAACASSPRFAAR